jgi:hypothetical protein
MTVTLITSYILVTTTSVSSLVHTRTANSRQTGLTCGFSNDRIRNQEGREKDQFHVFILIGQK